MGDLTRPRSIGVHDPDFRRLCAIALERDAFPAGKPRRRFVEIRSVVSGHLTRSAGCCIHNPDVRDVLLLGIPADLDGELAGVRGPCGPFHMPLHGGMWESWLPGAGCAPHHHPGFVLGYVIDGAWSGWNFREPRFNISAMSRSSTASTCSKPKWAGSERSRAGV